MAEKALKAVALSREAVGFRTRSVTKLAKQLGINDRILRSGKILDLYYIPPRYPDALPQGIGNDFFTSEQAQQAIELAEQVLEYCKTEVE